MMGQDDTVYMQIALELARLGTGRVSPNPLVGTVIVKDGAIVGCGYYRYDRTRHAERYALDQAGELARGATLYCTLEPCSHQGRTPPCSEALISAGIGRVVAALTDPNPRVNGAGINQLCGAGIAVEAGLCAAEARRLNEVYLKWAATGKPFLHTLRYPRVAGAVSRLLPLLRQYDAILVGEDVAAESHFIGFGAARPRHRPLVIAGSEERVRPFRDWHGAMSDSLVVELPVGWEEAGDAQSSFGRLSEYGVTGALVLVSSLPAPRSWILENCDKLTTFETAGDAKRREDDRGPEPPFTLSETRVNREAGFVEITSYRGRSSDDVQP